MNDPRSYTVDTLRVSNFLSYLDARYPKFPTVILEYLPDQNVYIEVPKTYETLYKLFDVARNEEATNITFRLSENHPERKCFCWLVDVSSMNSEIPPTHYAIHADALRAQGLYTPDRALGHILAGSMPGRRRRIVTSNSQFIFAWDFAESILLTYTELDAWLRLLPESEIDKFWEVKSKPPVVYNLSR